MKLKEFKERFKGKNISVRDLNGKDITCKPRIILDMLTVIGSEHHPDGRIVVDVAYID